MELGSIPKIDPWWIGLDVAAGVLLITLVAYAIKETSELYDFISLMIGAIAIVIITMGLIKVRTTETGVDPNNTPKLIFAIILACILGFVLAYPMKKNYDGPKKNKK